jgi:hypothetical protein
MLEDGVRKRTVYEDAVVQDEVANYCALESNIVGHGVIERDVVEGAVVRGQ